MKTFYVYLLASEKNGTLYTGVTSNLVRRIFEHKNGMVEGFSKKYNVQRLVYFEEFSDTADAFEREKRIKKWNRAWKIRLIERNNPGWKDLYEDLV